MTTPKVMVPKQAAKKSKAENATKTGCKRQLLPDVPAEQPKRRSLTDHWPAAAGLTMQEKVDTMYNFFSEYYFF